MREDVTQQKRVRNLALACHPGPTVAVTTFSMAMAAGASAPASTTALVGAAVLAGQLSIGWSNDWIDADRDAAVGRTDKPVGAGLLPVAVVRNAALIALATSAAFSMALGWRAGLVQMFVVAMGWAYNLGLKSTAWSWAAICARVRGIATRDRALLTGPSGCFLVGDRGRRALGRRRSRSQRDPGSAGRQRDWRARVAAPYGSDRHEHRVGRCAHDGDCVRGVGASRAAPRPALSQPSSPRLP